MDNNSRTASPRRTAVQVVAMVRLVKNEDRNLSDGTEVDKDLLGRLGDVSLVDKVFPDPLDAAGWGGVGGKG